MPAPTTADRIRGSLLGLAWGDAFGCPMEGWRAGRIADFFGDCRGLIDAWPGAARGLPPRDRRRLRPIGLHSDDTQQAIALVGCCLEGFSPERWGEWLVEGFAAGAWRGFGRNFVGAVHRLRKGGAPGAAGSPSAGMGAAMRIGPLGALLDGETLRETVFAASLMTHGDIRAAAIAFAVARTVRALIDGREPGVIRAALPELVAGAEEIWLAPREGWTHDISAGHQVSRGLAALLAGGIDDPAALRANIAKVARPHLADGFTQAHPNQGFALLGGAHGLLMALRDDAVPGETLAEIVRQGYDTDTVAAIAGAVLGARFGTDWIPTARLLDGPRLDAWADALISREAPEDRAAFFAAEAAHTAAEKRFAAEWVPERRTGR